MNNVINITSENFVRGIDGSGAVGTQYMQNIDAFNVPGVIRAEFKNMNTIPDPKVATFTADPSTEILTVSSTFDYVRENLTFTATGRIVRVSSTGTLPAGLVAGTDYFIIKVTSTTIKLATTLANALAGTAIDITTAGTGTHTITSQNPRRFEHYAVQIQSGTTVAADIVFAQDAEGKIWKFTASLGWQRVLGNTVDGSVGAGLAVWKDYLFSFRQSEIDLYGPLSGSPTWINSWVGETNLSTGNAPLNKNVHKALIGKDDILYFANAQNDIPWVGSLLETPAMTFDPTNAATYTFNGRALDLPDFQFITDFEELGQALMIATVGTSIYPWDRISSSFDLPVDTSEPNVTSIKTINNMMYYSCGIQGNIYRTLGTTSELVMDFSDQVSNSPQSDMFIDDMQIYKGGLIFSASGAFPGLYHLDINNGNRYLLKATLSGTGTPATIFTSNNPILTNLKYVSNRYFVSWDDNYYNPLSSTTVGCDSNYMLTNGPFRATGGTSYFISQVFQVAEDEEPFTFSTCKLQLHNPLPSGHSVLIRTRVDNETAFSATNQIVFDATTMSSNGTSGLTTAGTQPINIENARVFQCQVIIVIPAAAGADTSQYLSPMIRSVTFS